MPPVYIWKKLRQLLQVRNHGDRRHGRHQSTISCYDIVSGITITSYSTHHEVALDVNYRLKCTIKISSRQDLRSFPLRFEFARSFWP